MVERFIVFEGAAGERTDGFVEPGWRARSVFGPHRHSRLVPGLLIRWGFLLEVVQSHQHGPAGCLPACRELLSQQAHPGLVLPRAANPGQLAVEDGLGEAVIAELVRRGQQVLCACDWTLGRMCAAAATRSRES